MVIKEQTRTMEASVAWTPMLRACKLMELKYRTRKEGARTNFSDLLKTMVGKSTSAQKALKLEAFLFGQLWRDWFRIESERCGNN